MTKTEKEKTLAAAKAQVAAAGKRFNDGRAVVLMRRAAMDEAFALAMSIPGVRQEDVAEWAGVTRLTVRRSLDRTAKP